MTSKSQRRLPSCGSASMFAAATYPEDGRVLMTHPISMRSLPKKILLATDLGSRSDRALDRAASLAAQWQTSLIAPHVLENFSPNVYESAPLPSWRRPPDPAGAARKHVLARRISSAEAPSAMHTGAFAPMSGLMTDATAYLRTYRDTAAKACDAFLTVDRPQDWQEPSVLMEYGSPPSLLRGYNEREPCRPDRLRHPVP